MGLGRGILPLHFRPVVPGVFVVGNDGTIGRFFRDGGRLARRVVGEQPHGAIGSGDARKGVS